MRKDLSSSHHWSLRVMIIVTAVLATVIVGVAVGTGVGVGLPRRDSSTGPAPGAASTVTKTASAKYVLCDPQSTIHIQLMPRKSHSVRPTGGSLLTNRRILDDTSMAALSLPGGDRRLFFQDQSGIIRQAFYSSASRQWRADINYLVASDAKNHTPMAVANPPTSITPIAFGNVS